MITVPESYCSACSTWIEPAGRPGATSSGSPPSWPVTTSSGPQPRRTVSSRWFASTSQRSSRVSGRAGATAGQPTGDQPGCAGARTSARTRVNSAAPALVTRYSVPGPRAALAWSARYSVPRRLGWTSTGSATGLARSISQTSVVSREAAVTTASSPLRAACRVSS
jgi:hypothetical protein